MKLFIWHTILCYLVTISFGQLLRITNNDTSACTGAWADESISGLNWSEPTRLCRRSNGNLTAVNYTAANPTGSCATIVTPSPTSCYSSVQGYLTLYSKGNPDGFRTSESGVGDSVSIWSNGTLLIF